jgi:SanA protein
LLVLLAAATAVAIPAWVQWRYEGDIWATVGGVPARPVAIVFGAAIYPNGQLSPMLQDRVDMAIDLYRAGKVRNILMSGDNRFLDYDEPGRMYDYAVARGLPPASIIRDYAGRRTYDTCYRAKEIFGVTDAILVSQRFHLARALYTCSVLGVESVGVAAEQHEYPSEAYYWLRDTLATLQAWWDVTIARPVPVLGERIGIGL